MSHLPKGDYHLKQTKQDSVGEDVQNLFIACENRQQHSSLPHLPTKLFHRPWTLGRLWFHLLWINCYECGHSNAHPVWSVTWPLKERKCWHTESGRPCTEWKELSHKRANARCLECSNLDTLVIQCCWLPGAGKEGNGDLVLAGWLGVWFVWFVVDFETRLH